jgi:putative (di)nucleoside polyphosphate hydrolase
MTKDETDETGAPGSERGYRPCVGIMVLNAGGLVWVGQRSDTPGDAEGRGAWWQMPQGGIDEGEDPERAAYRELYEETGMRTVKVVASIASWLTYDLPPQLQGKAWGGRYRGQKQRWFLMRFNGSESEINILPAPGHEREFDTWRWAPAGELLELVVPFKRPVYAAVMGEFGPLALPA